jgi:hypothetical protein
VPTFAARLRYRPQIMHAGLLVMLVCVAGAVVAAVENMASAAPYIAGVGGLVYFVAVVVAMIPQSGTIAIDGDTVTPSWGAPIRMHARPELASWVIAGIDAAMGLAITIPGLRIGIDKHDGEGYELRGSPRRTVDCQVDKDTGDALLAALGFTRGKPGPLVVPLVRSAQTFGGVVRAMLPWLVTMTVLAVAAVIVGSTEVGEEFARTSHGQLTMAIGSGALAVIAIVVMIVRGRRVRMPELELRFSDDALSVGEQQIPWSAVTIEKLTYTVSSRYGAFAMPVLVLGIGDRKPLRLGAYDGALAWSGATAKTWRAPTWLVAATKWPRLLAALEAR